MWCAMPPYILILFSLVLQSVSPTPPLPRKCCSNVLILDTSDQTYPQCRRSSDHSLNISVDTSTRPRLPNCKAEYEVHHLAKPDSWIAGDGSLLTTKYGEDYHITDFCVDRDVAGQLVAVTCDACKEKVEYQDSYNKI